MKLKIAKNSGEVEIKISNNSEEIDFDYIKFINLLYEKNSLEKTEFSKDISFEEKEKIEEMIEEINKIVESQKDSSKK